MTNGAKFAAICSIFFPSLLLGTEMGLGEDIFCPETIADRGRYCTWNIGSSAFGISGRRINLLSSLIVVTPVLMFSDRTLDAANTSSGTQSSNAKNIFPDVSHLGRNFSFNFCSILNRRGLMAWRAYMTWSDSALARVAFCEYNPS